MKLHINTCLGTIWQLKGSNRTLPVLGDRSHITSQLPHLSFSQIPTPEVTKVQFTTLMHQVQSTTKVNGS